MQMPDVDRNLQYLALTLLIIVVVVGYHNVTTTENAVRSFGMCDQSIECRGVSAGDACIGYERPTVTCMSTEEAPAWRRAEVECGLDAQGLCNANPGLSGTEWTDDPSAAWNGKRCTQWAQEQDEFDLLACEDTFNDITQWNGEQQG